MHLTGAMRNQDLSGRLTYVQGRHLSGLGSVAMPDITPHRLRRQVAQRHAERARGQPGALHRPVPPDRAPDARRGRPDRAAWFAFEKGASKTAGGEGFADVWKTRLLRAGSTRASTPTWTRRYQQLLQYREALENPPLLVVCDIERIVIHTNFTNTVKRTYDADARRPAQARGGCQAADARSSTTPKRCEPPRRPTQVTAARRRAVRARWPSVCAATARTPRADHRPLPDPPALLPVRRGRRPAAEHVFTRSGRAGPR